MGVLLQQLHYVASAQGRLMSSGLLDPIRVLGKNHTNLVSQQHHVELAGLQKHLTSSQWLQLARLPAVPLVHWASITISNSKIKECHALVFQALVP